MINKASLFCLITLILMITGSCFTEITNSLLVEKVFQNLLIGNTLAYFIVDQFME